MRIDELERENAELRAMLPADDPTRALPAPAPERTITPSISDIVPPSERTDLPQNQRYRHGPDGKPLRVGQTIDEYGRVVPVAPVAKSGAETELQRQRVNNDRAFVHKVMTAPSRVSGEPKPSTGPRIVQDGAGFFWSGNKGRAW